MKKEKVNKLYITLIEKIETNKINIEENFYEFLQDILREAHWVSKYSIYVYLFFLDILSLIFFFQSFENLNKIKAQKLLKFISKIIFLNDIEDMLKKYALIYMYDKN
tara:strand:+ start:1964 stop:2284 length:321 start_codon:yes stop_codon:yes gene_type:complete